MKYLLIILLWFLTFPALATKYYCAPSGGSDGNAGTNIAAPWATVQWAIEHTPSGDTCYFRAGTWQGTSAVSVDHLHVTTGTALHPTCYFNYPSEVPIIDGTNVTDAGNFGIQLTSMTYMHFKGITVRNFWENINATGGQGFYPSNCNCITFENCIAYNIGGRGFYSNTCDSTIFLNCDAHDVCDYNGSPAGGGAQGFVIISNIGVKAWLTGCRAWHCSDDGFGFAYEGTYIVNACWSWNNSPSSHNGPYGIYPHGDGNGFKYGTFGIIDAPMSRMFTNCISAYNYTDGFNENADGGTKHDGYLYNNIAYKNTEFGFVGRTPAYNLDNILWYKNNIAYANVSANASFDFTYEHEYNSWDHSPAVTVSNADFVSVDSTGLSGARQADGSLPILTFLHLKVGSDLIGAGIGVGLVYDGDNLYHNDPPDLGAFAYNGGTPTPPELPQISTTAITTYNAYTATIGGNITSTGGGTITTSGVVWNTAINPTLSNNVIPNGRTTVGTFSNSIFKLNGGITYHFRAYTTNETGTSYGADVSLTTPAYAIMKSATKIYFLNGKPMIYK